MDVQLTVFVFTVRYLDTLPVVTSELPAVEGTLDAVALHLCTHRQTGAHVWAVRVDSMHFSFLVSKNCKLETYNNDNKYMN